MIDKNKVEKYLIDICNLSKEEIDKNKTLIDVQIKNVEESLYEDKFCDDERVIALAGASSNYSILLNAASNQTVTSFTAGDISIKENNDYLTNAKELVEMNFNNCTCFLSDNSFAFLGV